MSTSYATLIKWRKIHMHAHTHNHITYCRKSIWQNPTPSHDKNNLGIEAKLPNFIIYGKPILNGERPNGERLKDFPIIRSKINQGCSLLVFLFVFLKYIYWLCYYSCPFPPLHSTPSCSPPPSHFSPTILHVHGSCM